MIEQPPKPDVPRPPDVISRRQRKTHRCRRVRNMDEHPDIHPVPPPTDPAPSVIDAQAPRSRADVRLGATADELDADRPPIGRRSAGIAIAGCPVMLKAVSAAASQRGSARVVRRSRRCRRRRRRQIGRRQRQASHLSRPTPPNASAGPAGASRGRSPPRECNTAHLEPKPHPWRCWRHETQACRRGSTTLPAGRCADRRPRSLRSIDRRDHDVMARLRGRARPRDARRTSGSAGREVRFRRQVSFVSSSSTVSPAEAAVSPPEVPFIAAKRMATSSAASHRTDVIQRSAQGDDALARQLSQCRLQTHCAAGG